MRKGVKIVGWLAGVVVLLLVVAVVGIKLYLNKERVLGWVVPPLEEALHRQVTIADVGAGLTGLHLDELVVQTPGAEFPLVSTGRVQVSWNLWSLLSGTVEITEVRLVEPRIHVTKLADGSLDIDDLTAPQKEAETPAPAPAAEQPGAGAGVPPVGLVVRVFALQDGRVSYLDRSARPEVNYVLDGIDARVTEITLDGPIPFELSANLPLSPAGRFSGEGTLNAATRDVDATLRIDAFDLTSLNEVLNGGMAFASGILDVDLKVRLEGGERAATVGGVKVAGLALAEGDRRGKQADLSLQLDAAASLNEEAAQLKSVALTVAEQTLTGNGQVDGWGKRPKARFLLEAEELRVDDLLALLPPAPDAGEETPAPAPAPPTQGAGAPPGDVPVDAVGDIRIAALRHGSVLVENLAVHLSLKDNKLKVEPATADLYGGALSSTLAADLASAGPVFETAARLEKVSVDKLLAAVDPKLRDTVTGTAFLDLTATGTGGDLAALDSRSKLELKDGKLMTHPLVQEFSEMFQVKEYRTLNFYSLLADVGTAGGTATVDSLVFRGHNLQATGKGTVGLVDPALDMRLVVALPREVAEKVVGNRDVVGALTDEEGWTRLPMRLAGSPSAPSYGVDAKALEKVAAKALEDKGKRLLEEKVLKDAPVDDATKGLLDKGLKSLFGR